jgi:hypothetical protein
MTEPDAVLDDPQVRRVLDLSQPLALICTATLYFVADDAHPHEAIARYRDLMAAGSHLAISHATSSVADDYSADEARDTASQAADVYSNASAHLHLRSLTDIRRFFDGFELIEPGVVWMSRWRPEPGAEPGGRLESLYAGVGRKP